MELWAPKCFLGGHFESVNDLSWSPDSSYVITASSDQTCRLYAPLQHSDLIANYDNNCCDSGESVTLTSTCDSNSNSSKLTHSPWREISRPQIHGYDLHSIAVSPSLAKYHIFSGADEKVLRVFDAPSCVIEGLTTLCGRNRIKNTSTGTGTSDSTGPRVTRAYIPELGLSNRASETMSNQEKTDQDARNVQTLNWTYTPLEGQLADYTVWPGKNLFLRSLIHSYNLPNYFSILFIIFLLLLQFSTRLFYYSCFHFSTIQLYTTLLN